MTKARILFVVLFFVITIGAEQNPLFAAGGTLHIFMSDLALSKVQDAELKQLLERHKNAVLWASWYPDSGYAGSNEYGEYSHWSPFLNGYIDYIQNVAGEDHPEFERLVAHALGTAAHGIQDQVFDHLFLQKTGEMDGTGQKELDFGLDLVCMWDYGRHSLKVPDQVLVDHDKYTSVDHLVNVYGRLGKNYNNIRQQIISGQALLASGMIGEKTIFIFGHDAVRRQSPWGASNYFQAPGGVIHNAEITARYWEALWKRIKSDSNPFVIGTFPENNDKILSTKTGTIDSDISIFFSKKYKRSSINTSTFIVSDDNGNQISGSFAWCYSSNMVRFKPSIELNSPRYSVTLTTDVQDEFGNTMADDFNFSFRTPQCREKCYEEQVGCDTVTKCSTVCD